MKQLDLSGLLTLKEFSDNDIFEIQDNFLTPGFHYIKFETVESGRLFFTAMLESLNCYSSKAYLSYLPFDTVSTISNLYQELFQAEAISADNGAMEDFILNYFYYDFLLIEQTEQIAQQNWFSKFKDLLIDYNLTQTLPIVLFSYAI